MWITNWAACSTVLFCGALIAFSPLGNVLTKHKRKIQSSASTQYNPLVSTLFAFSGCILTLVVHNWPTISQIVCELYATKLTQLDPYSKALSDD